MLDRHELNMLGSITYMARLSLDDKKLKTLREQLYGKNKEKKRFSSASKLSDRKVQSDQKTAELPLPFNPSNTLTDTTFVGKDLSKIFILGSIAIGCQLVLYFAMRNGLLDLGTFIKF